MQDVINLSEYKPKRVNPDLLLLKENIKKASNDERSRFYNMWVKALMLFLIFAILLMLPTNIASGNLAHSIVSSSIFINAAILAILEINKIITGSIIFTNHFKEQKELLIDSKNIDFEHNLFKLKFLLLDYSVGYYNYLSSGNPKNIARLMTNPEYLKLKDELQITNNYVYLKLVEKEKEIIQLSKEIRFLDNLTKEDLNRI